MDAFLMILADFFMAFYTTIELLSSIGGFLFFVFLIWATTSRKAHDFFEWVYEEFFR